MDSFTAIFRNDMKMHCPVCRMDSTAFCCAQCAVKRISEFHHEAEAIREEVTQVVHKMDFSISSRQDVHNPVIQILMKEISHLRKSVSFLDEELRIREDSLSFRRQRLGEDRQKFEARKKRVMPRQEFTLTFETYIKETSRYDKNLSSLHPFRKLRSIAQTLFDERRSLCMKLLSIFRFRLINMHEDNSQGDIAGSSPQPAAFAGVSELVGDFYTMDGQKDQLGVVMLFIVPLLIILSKIIDVPLPFALVYGTLCSSPTLNSPKSVYSFGSSPYPRILYAHKRLLIPMEPSLSHEALGLLTENLRYLSSMANQTHLSSVPFMEPMTLLSTIFTSSNLGRAIYRGPMSCSFPSSPSLSASTSPILSSSYRKAVIEQSLTEGGEWTLLDQL